MLLVHLDKPEGATVSGGPARESLAVAKVITGGGADRKFNRMRQSMTRFFGIQAPVSLWPMQFEPTQSLNSQSVGR